MKMKTTFWMASFIAFPLLLASGAHAKSGKHPCKSDSEKLCAKVAVTEIPNCLLSQETKLSSTCSQAIQKNLDRGPACANTRKLICSDKTIGKGLGSCILENEKALNDACAKEASKI